MGILMQNDSLVGGIDSSLVNKIGTAPLDTVAQDLSGAVNELKATGGGGNVDDVYVNGVSVLDSNKIAQIDLTGKVNTTGDTMTGNLIIKNATAGAVQITNPNTDLREADNNVSSAQFNQFRIVDDGSHMTMGYFGTTVYPEGLVQGTLQVSNFDTNGDPVSNGISLTVDKGGSKSYSVSDEAAFRRAIGVLNRPAANAGADLSLVTTGDKYDWNNKVSKSGDTMTGALSMAGTDINLKTFGSSSDDSGDIVWYYGNGNEKARLWTNNEYTAESGLNFRMYKKDGTSLFSGTVPLRNTTYSIGTGDSNGQIKVTPSSGSAYNVGVKGLGSAAYLNADTAASANTVVKRDANKYIYATYYNSNISNENINSYTNDVAVMFTSNDKWIRRTTKANLQTWLGLGSAAYKATSAFAAASHSHSNYQTTLSSTSTNTGGKGTSIRKYGNVCWMPLFNCAANKVGTIPSGYRPGAMCRALLLCIVSSKVYYCIGEVSTAGAFKCWYYPTYPGSSSTEIQGTANTLYGEMIWIT